MNQGIIEVSMWHLSSSPVSETSQDFPFKISRFYCCREAQSEGLAGRETSKIQVTRSEKGQLRPAGDEHSWGRKGKCLVLGASVGTVFAEMLSLLHCLGNFR